MEYCFDPDDDTDGLFNIDGPRTPNEETHEYPNRDTVTDTQEDPDQDGVNDMIQASEFAHLINTNQSRHFEELSERGDWDPTQESVVDKFSAEARIIAMHDELPGRDQYYDNRELPPKPSTIQSDSETREINNLDSQETPLDPSVRVVGEYTIDTYKNIIDQDGYAQLQPMETSVVYEVLSRCCNSYRPVTAKSIKTLGLEIKSHSEPVTAVYVGWSAALCEPVYFKNSETGRIHSLPLMDDTSEVQTRSEPSNQQCQKNVIFHEGALVPGNIVHIKRAFFGELSNNETKTFKERLMRENKVVLNGLIPSPVMKVRGSRKSPDKAPVFGTNGLESGIDQHYKLMYPLLSAMLIPQELVTLVDTFLRKHGQDPMPLNTAIAAVIVFYDLHKHQPNVEPFVPPKSKTKWAEKHKTVTMTQFVIYFPHLLRFYENGRYTRYTHPLRWTYQQYRRDSKANDRFRLGSGDTQLPQGQLLDLVSRIKGREGSDPGRRVHLIPQSMPGTRLIWPQDPPAGAMNPSNTVDAMCLLNDINTLGLPSYHYRENAIQPIGAPYRLSVHWLRQESESLDRLVETPTPLYWFPDCRPLIACLTGNVPTIGPVFTDLIGSCDEPHQTPPSQGSHALQVLSKKGTLASFINQTIKDEYAVFNNYVINLAAVKGKTLRWDADNMRCTYDGLDNDVLTEEKSGALTAMVKYGRLPNVPMPPLKRRKTSHDEDTSQGNKQSGALHVPLLSRLDETERKECLDALVAIKAVGAYAWDWERLVEQLRNKNALRSTVLKILRDINADLVDLLRSPLDQDATVKDIHAQLVGILRGFRSITPQAAMNIDLTQDWVSAIKEKVTQVNGEPFCTAIDLCIMYLHNVSNEIAKQMLVREVNSMKDLPGIKAQIELADKYLHRWQMEESN